MLLDMWEVELCFYGTTLEQREKQVQDEIDIMYRKNYARFKDMELETPPLFCLDIESQMNSWTEKELINHL